LDAAALPVDPAPAGKRRTRRAPAHPPDSSVEVVILCKNEGAALRECLEGIVAQQIDARFSITVVDSGTTDGGLDLVRSMPVRLIEIAPEDFHHARTRNFAAEQTQAPILVFTNGHTVPVDSAWLARLTATLREDQHGEIAGSYGGQVPRRDAYPMERFMLSELYGPARRVQRAVAGRPVALRETMFSTVNCAIRRDLWQRRPFSDRVATSEDQEWTRHWLERGYAITYEPAAAVIHSHNQRLPGLFRRYYGFGVSSELSYLPREGSAPARFALSSLGYLGREAIFLARNGYAGWLPYAAVFECVKVVAWLLGRYHALLPVAVRRRIAG
jgi:rhamnosyltransferase